MNELRQLVADKTVAIVGNSESILDRKDGHVIDSYDIVLRINLGLPGLNVSGKRIKRESVGWKTNIWATSRYWPNAVPKECLSIIWMKLGKLGKFDLKSLIDSNPHCPVYNWDHQIEDEIRKFVGADPSTGIQMIYWMCKYAYPKSIGIFGFDCWAKNTHWSGHGPASNINPELEKSAMERLGFK